MPARAGGAAWLVVALILLSVIPLANGAFRLSQLAGGAVVTPANARFVASPLPVALHIVSAGVYAILGAFQFVPSLRRRRGGWHRIAGRILIPNGLIVALSGLLIAARAAQGFGAAIMMALTMALVGETVPKAKTGNANGEQGAGHGLE